MKDDDQPVNCLPTDFFFSFFFLWFSRRSVKARRSDIFADPTKTALFMPTAASPPRGGYGEGGIYSVHHIPIISWSCRQTRVLLLLVVSMLVLILVLVPVLVLIRVPTLTTFFVEHDANHIGTHSSDLLVESEDNCAPRVAVMKANLEIFQASPPAKFAV